MLDNVFTPVKLDNTDRAIINCLRANGRMPATEIANTLSQVSARVVQYRIEKLIDQGVVKVKAIVNPASFGLSVRADVLLSVDVSQIKDIANYLAEFEDIRYIACLLSSYHIAIGMQFKDNPQLYNFITEKIGSIAGIQEVVLILTPILIKSVYDWHIPGTEALGGFTPFSPPEDTFQDAIYDLNEVDWKILNLLLEDGRLSAVKISEHLGEISSNVVRQKIQHLNEIGILRFGALINPRAVGYPVITDMAIKVASERVKDVAMELARLEEVSYVARAIGGRDISIQIYSQHLEALYLFIAEVVHKIPGIVETSIMIQAEQIKGIHDWRIPRSIIEEV